MNDLVSPQLNNLTRMFMQDQANRRADERGMAGLNIQSAQVEQAGRNALMRNRLEEAKFRRQQFMDEVVTGRQAIMTHPGLNPEQKADAIKRFPDDILDGLFAKRREWPEIINKAHSKWKESLKEQERHKEEMGIERDKLAVMRKSRDNRPNIQKEVEFIAQTTGTTLRDALKMYRKDKTLGERIRLYNNELDNLAKDFDFQDLDEKGKAQKINKLRKSYGISDVMGDGGVSQGQSGIGLPKNITKASEALKHLIGQGMSEEQARSWLKDYMSK